MIPSTTRPGLTKARPRNPDRPTFTGIEQRYIVRMPSFRGISGGALSTESLELACAEAAHVGGSVFDKMTGSIVAVAQEAP